MGKWQILYLQTRYRSKLALLFWFGLIHVTIRRNLAYLLRFETLRLNNLIKKLIHFYCLSITFRLQLLKVLDSERRVVLLAYMNLAHIRSVRTYPRDSGNSKVRAKAENYDWSIFNQTKSAVERWRQLQSFKYIQRHL